jgi:galactokinase
MTLGESTCSKTKGAHCLAKGLGQTLPKDICVSAPGRICLFGEHQDFLGLSVIACPIDLRIAIRGRPANGPHFVIHMPDISAEDSFPAGQTLPYTDKRDYLRSTVNVLARKGLRVTRPHECTIRSTIPLQAGVSSSSALCVAWAKYLLETQEGEIDRSPEALARYAHEAEVREFNEPGGMMDHYTSAMGGLLYIDCAEPITVTPLPAVLDGFVLGDSLQRKETLEILARSRGNVTKGVQWLKERICFDLKTTPRAEVESALREMPHELRRGVEANLINRDLCQEARSMLASGTVDPVRLGAMLTEHHKQLRDGLDVSTDRVERLISASLEAGALGAKINGSGGGGCMFAYAPGRQQQVKDAIDAAGGVGYVVKMDSGVRLDS